MNHGFSIGVGVGVLGTAAVVWGSLLLCGDSGKKAAGGSAGPGKASSEKSGRPPFDPAPRPAELAALKAELEKARSAETAVREEAKLAEAHAKFAEKFLEQIGKEHGELQEQIDKTLREQREADERQREAQRLRVLRDHIEWGKSLPDDVVEYLGITQEQRGLLDSELVAESEKIMDVYRDLVGDDPRVAEIVQKKGKIEMEDYWGVVFPLVGDQAKKLRRTAEAAAPGQKVCIEEVLGKDALLTRLFGGLAKAREGMHGSAGRYLDETQRKKLRSLFWSNYYGISVGPNVLAYRPE